MKILAYRGISIISILIKFQTRSIYSHIAVETDRGMVYEAWHRGGVQSNSSFKRLHTQGTKVDIFELVHPENFDVGKAKVFLKDQIGKKYDFWSVGRFLTRRKAQANNKWFCSELAEEAFKHGGVHLLNGNPSEHSPRDIVLSPYLRLVETRVV